jgi:RNA polymerase sigma-70 factor, ECF subfamily
MNEPSLPPSTVLEPASALDWGETLAAHEGWLRRVVAARLDEPQAVDEVMQDVALAAVAQHSPLRNPARVAVWLYRLAVRHVLMHRRKSSRRRSLVDRYTVKNGVREVDPAPSPLGWLVRDERQQLVQSALRKLTPRDGELLVLKYAEGLPARELAQRLGVTVNTIEARLHRARHRLRCELAALATEFEVSHHE